MLTTSRIDEFITQGYVRIEQAFSSEVAKRCRDILWEETGCDPTDPSTWTKPVVWLWAYSDEPFLQAANSPALRSAFDQLVGEDRWAPIASMGTFPLRFPTSEDTGDTGWHVDASFPGRDSLPGDFLTWHINVHSRGRALLALFLFSDVGESDAPTRIRMGSHLDVARMLAPAGEEGVGVTAIDYAATSGRLETTATGEAGDVYLCHPFLVHAAQINRGVAPRFMAQPPLFPRGAFHLEGKEDGGYAPVERAIRMALGKE